MKTSARYWYRPVKYLLLLLIVVAVLYFRAAIFHNNVNQFIDRGDAALETLLGINIPEYLPGPEPAASIIADSRMEAVDCDSTPDETTTQAVTGSNRQDASLSSAEELVRAIHGEEPIAVDAVAASDSLVLQSENSEKLDQSLSLIEQLALNLQDMQSKMHRIDESTRELIQQQRKLQEELQPYQSLRQSESNGVTSPETVTEKTVDLSGDAQAVLLMARQSFWNGNSPLSEKIYLQLTKDDQDNPDVFGELGNVYYSQGKWEQAGKAYYQAAIRLLDMKRRPQVNYLLRVIEGLDTESAELLRQKLSG